MITKNHVIIIGICISIFKCSNGKNSFADWKTYQGDFGRNQYSSLTQVNKQNVNKLVPLWIYKTGNKTWGLLYIIWITIVLFVCIVIAYFIFK